MYIWGKDTRFVGALSLEKIAKEPGFYLSSQNMIELNRFLSLSTVHRDWLGVRLTLLRSRYRDGEGQEALFMSKNWRLLHIAAPQPVFGGP